MRVIILDYICILKKSLIVILLIVIFFIGCKLSLFYIPFIIAYIISIIVEPMIVALSKRTGFSRKVNSIIVLATIFIFFIIGITLGGIKLISETTNLLSGLNDYLDKTLEFINSILLL